MKKKTSIAAPVLWAVFTIVWTINLCLHASMKHDEALLVLSVLCMIGGVLNTATQWLRYKRGRDSENGSGEKR